MSSTSELDVLHVLEQNVLEASAQGREVFDVGPFRVFITPETDLKYLNYAVPIRACESWSEPISELVSAFTARGRLPRLEYLAGLWPGLQPVLEAEGFQLELAAPLMTLAKGELRAPPRSSADVHLLRPDDPSALFEAYYQVGAQGFGMPLPEAPEVAEQKHRPWIADGTFVAALARVDGVSAGCGCLMRSGEVAEMAGVATLDAFRRKGVAAHLCVDLLRAGFDAGLRLVWLSAATTGAVALYESLGFRHIGAQIHISFPEMPARPPAD